MRIEAIEITDWMAFAGRHHLELPAGAIAVVAAYADNPRRSNWAGKSALLEAIDWALTGSHRKRAEDDLIHRGASEVRVRLVLTGGVEIERRRARGKATRIGVKIGEKVWQKAAAVEKIRSVVGLDAADYRATSYFVQGDAEAIVAKTSGERRKTVGEWLDLTAWLRVAARARAHARKLLEEHGAARQALEYVVASAEGKDPVEIATRLGVAAGEVFVAREELAELDAVLEGEAAHELTRQDEARIETLVGELKLLRERLTGHGIRPDLLEEVRERRTEASARLRAAEEEVTAARRLRAGDFDGVCPVTCGECPVADQIRADTAAATSKLEEARRRRDAARETAREADAEARGLETRAREVAALRERYKAARAQVADLQRAIEERAAAAGSEPLTDAAYQDVIQRRQRVRMEEVASERDLRAWQDRAREREDLEVMREDRRAHLEALEAAVREAALATRATGPTGIPASIAEASLGLLEERANVILADSGLGFSFAWDREARGLAPTCDDCGYAYRGQRDKACPACGAARGPKRVDELDILVDDGSGVVEDVSAKSGGAKILVAAAIRLTAGLLLRERRGSRCAWAVVDEPFGMLDAENRETLARTFVGLLGSVGLEQAFVVSHDAALLAAAPHQIQIVRDPARGSSSVELVR